MSDLLNCALAISGIAKKKTKHICFIAIRLPLPNAGKFRDQILISHVRTATAMEVVLTIKNPRRIDRRNSDSVI